MPANDSNGVFSTGRDMTLVLAGPQGNIQLDNIKEFTEVQTVDEIQVKRMDGVVLLAALPQTWGGTIQLERAGPSLDETIGALESNWFTSGVASVFQLYRYTIEPDNSTTTIAYDNVTLKADMGTWRSDASVPMKLEWKANRRRPIS